MSITQKRIYDKLFSNNSKVEKTSLKRNHKVSLAIGDESSDLISELESTFEKFNSEINRAFAPIRELEKKIERIKQEGLNTDGFKEFKDALMSLESQFNKDTDKISQIEQDLGMKIPMPESISKVSQVLSEYQGWEQTFRDDINEYNEIVKNFNI
jgi:uncharacterized protein YukE